jgi:iron complex outermembrane recepter protein
MIPSNRAHRRQLDASRKVISGFVIAAFCCSSAFAQSRVEPATTGQQNDDRILLSPFEVSETKDKGYTSTNAATGFKTNESLMRIPQAVTLVTRDLIDDLGYTQSSDVLQFAGVSNFYRGESYALRGTRVGFTMVDEIPDQTPFADNAYVDSYTVLRGPASTLYLNAALSGTVLVSTKKPMPTPAYSITAKTDSNGMIRGEVDLTGPIGSIGDARFGYRLVAAMQGGDTFLKHEVDDRVAIHPTLQMAYKNTVVRLAFDWQEIDHAPNANGIVTPEGKLYTGAGRDEGYFVPGSMENHEQKKIRLTILQKLSDNWDVKISAQDWSYWRLGSTVFPSGGVNWPNQTMTFTARRNDRGDDFQTALLDVVGKYTFLGRNMQTALGAAYAQQIGEGWIRATSNFGSRVVSISNPQLETLVAPPGSAFPRIAGGTRSTTYRANGYFQQTVDIIPDRLIAIAGLTYSKIKTNDVGNLFTLPPATVTVGDEYLHRLGLVFNITPEIALYAMESTTFAPTANRDFNRNLLPNQAGTGREIGVKTNLMDGRVSSTFSLFDLELSNQSVFAGVRPDGSNYFAPIGTTIQRGWDFDVAVTPMPGLQFVGTAYDGTVEDQNGAVVANTYKRSLSFFGRYEFQNQRLKGLTVGGGAARISGRTVALAANYILPAGVPRPTVLYLDPGTLVNVFANYRINDWTFRGSIENVLDEVYPLGAQAAYFVDISPPRTFTFSVSRRF